MQGLELQRGLKQGPYNYKRCEQRHVHRPMSKDFQGVMATSATAAPRGGTIVLRVLFYNHARTDLFLAPLEVYLNFSSVNYDLTTAMNFYAS